jgi:hypothetical protein
MKLIALTFACLVLTILQTGAQTILDWSSSFSPAWSDGTTSRTATNITPGNNCTVTITNSQPGNYEDILFNVPSPAVNQNNNRNGFFVIAGSSDCLEIDVDWSSDNAYVDVVYEFTKPVYNLVFRIGDIDKAANNSNTYYDRVTISGLNETTSVNPVSITEVNPSNYVVITGNNTVHATTSNSQGGNAATNSTNNNSQQATVEVSFGTQGVTKLTIRYDNHPSAQNNPNLQAIAIGNLSFRAVPITGTIWNDINNSAANSFSNIFSTGETGTDAGGLFVNLVNSSGIIITSAAVGADGTYQLNAPPSTNNLTIRLSTTEGIPGLAAPANALPAGWTATSPLQTANFNTGTAAISNRHFGIEQLPETATSEQETVPNPGGFNFSAIAGSAFQTGTGGHPNTADFANGTVTNMKILTFPTNTNAIRINNTTYTNGGTCPPSTTCTTWPAAGVTLAYTNVTGPSVPISIDPVDGNVNTVITIAAIDNAGKQDASPGTVTVPFGVVSISGTVWNDVNNSAANSFNNIFTTGEAGTNSSGLFVHLVNTSGTIISMATVAANGTYSLNGSPSTSNLSLRLNNTAGTVGSAAPSNTLPAGWINTSPLQTAAFNTATANITGRDFGIEQLPVTASSVQTSTGNPGGFNFTPVSASSFQTGTGGNPNTSDAAGGTVTAIRITAFPSNTNAIRVNTTTYISSGICAPNTTCTNWPAGGVTIPYTNGVGPSSIISIDPVDGNTSAVIPFAAIDNAGKEDPSPGTVTIPFAVIPLSGIVFNDANGDLVQNGTEQRVNGGNAGGGLLPGSALFANLVDAAGIVIASVPVSSNGTYTFPNVPQSTSNLTLQINTVQGVVGLTMPALVLPPGWASAGENKNGQGGSADAVRNGEIVVTAGNVTITLQNFGLDRMPVSQSKFFTIGTPVVNGFITLNGSGPLPGAFSGSDAEDGLLGAASTVAITSLSPEGNELWYDATQINTGADGVNPPSPTNPFVISGFDPSLFRVRATAIGSLGVSFDYAFIDAANVLGEPAQYIISWATPLPVTLTAFTGRIENANAIIEWKVENQEDFDRYEIEYAAGNSGEYRTIGTLRPGNEERGAYQFTHYNASSGGKIGSYRLKMIDRSGAFKYSHVITLRFEQVSSIEVRPTLLTTGEDIRIHFKGDMRQSYTVQLIDVAGRKHIQKPRNIEENLLLETRGLKPGIYFVQVKGKGAVQTFTILIL